MPDPDSDGTYVVEYRTPLGRDAGSVLEHPEYAGGRFDPGGVSVPYRTNVGARSIRSASSMELTSGGEAFRQAGETFTIRRRRLPVVPRRRSRAGLPRHRATFMPYPEDVDKQLTLAVTARKGGYRVARRTSAPVTVAWMSPKAPVVTGTTEVGKVLRVTTGDWGTGVGFSYRWFAGTTPVGQPDEDSLVLSSTMAGKQVHVDVTGTLEGSSATRSSALTVPVTVGWSPKTPTFPVPRVGTLLTVSTGDWGSGVTFTHRWNPGSTAIRNATKPTYTPTATQVGKNLSVKVTGSKPGHTTTSKVSSKVVIAKGVLTTAVPTITRTAKVGQTPYAQNGTWTSGTTFTYQWLSNGVAITNATASSYKLPSSEVGKNIQVVVTGSKPRYTTIALISAAAGPVVS